MAWPFSPVGHVQICFQQTGLGAEANAVAGDGAMVDLSLPQMLLDANRAYGDEVYENLMAYAAQLQVLGIVAGVIDGPTDEYRAAIAEAAGSYFSNLLDRSQRQAWYEAYGPLDVASSALGWWYEGFGAVAQVIPIEGVQNAGRQWDEIGDGLRNTDPDRLLANLGADFLQSLWDACTDRWNEFWEDFDNEGLLSAMARLKADADFLVAELAIDIALAVATSGAAAGVKIVAQRLLGSASRVVIRAASAASRAVPDDAILHAVRIADADIDPKILRQVLDEDNLRTGARRGDLTDRAEVDNPSTERPTGGNGGSSPDIEDVGPNPRQTDLGDGRVRQQRGTNDQIINYDQETGRPISSSGTIREDFGSTTRGDGATAIGHMGEPGDQGGHLAAHRFFGDTPDEGIAPQAGNLNQGAWKRMENEWADWTKMGYEVDYKVDVHPPGAVRPDAFRSTYSVRNPETGEIVYSNRQTFRNNASQAFNRVTWRDMQKKYGSNQ